jgi:NAD(P)H-hydrate epimerase
MAEADRLAVDVYGIDLLQMMEHAGSSLAEVVRHIAPEGEIVVLAGGGNNGGGGLCAARHLADRGRRVTVVTASQQLEGAAAHHLRTLEEMGVPAVEDPPDAPVAVDALVGYGLEGPLRGRVAELAAWSAGRTVVSLDLPSGLGHPGAVLPTATLTLALPKRRLEDVRPLFVADLGLPEALWERIGVSQGALFARGPIVEVTG